MIEYQQEDGHEFFITHVYTLYGFEKKKSGRRLGAYIDIAVALDAAHREMALNPQLVEVVVRDEATWHDSYEEALAPTLDELIENSSVSSPIEVITREEE